MVNILGCSVDSRLGDWLDNIGSFSQFCSIHANLEATLRAVQRAGNELATNLTSGKSPKDFFLGDFTAVLSFGLLSLFFRFSGSWFASARQTVLSIKLCDGHVGFREGGLVSLFLFLLRASFLLGHWTGSASFQNRFAVSGGRGSLVIGHGVILLRCLSRTGRRRYFSGLCLSGCFCFLLLGSWWGFRSRLWFFLLSGRGNS